MTDYFCTYGIIALTSLTLHYGPQKVGEPVSSGLLPKMWSYCYRIHYLPRHMHRSQPTQPSASGISVQSWMIESVLVAIRNLGGGLTCVLRLHVMHFFSRQQSQSKQTSIRAASLMSTYHSPGYSVRPIATDTFLRPYFAVWMALCRSVVEACYRQDQLV